MASPWFGEFMGTFILILLGNGVCANVLLKRSKAEGAGWMVVATGWGLGVFAGVQVCVTPQLWRRSSMSCQYPTASPAA